MKKVLYLLSIGVITLLTLSGCSKEKVEPENQKKVDDNQEEIQKDPYLNNFISKYSGKYSWFWYDFEGNASEDDYALNQNCAIEIQAPSDQIWDIYILVEEGSGVCFSINTNNFIFTDQYSVREYSMTINDFSDFKSNLPKTENLKSVTITLWDFYETHKREFLCSIAYNEGTSNVFDYNIRGFYEY